MKFKAKSISELTSALHLPRDYPWKVLRWLTEDLREFLSDHTYRKVIGFIRSRDVAGYLEWSKDTGLQSIAQGGGSIAEKRAIYQLTALLKKFRFATDKKTRQSRALNKFLECEAKCHLFNREGYLRLVGNEQEWVIQAITYAKGFIQQLLGVTLPSFDVLTERSRHGPGATLSTKAGLNSVYFKYADWPYQCTAAAFRYAKDAIRGDARWLGALEDDYRTRFNIPKHVLLDRRVFWSTVLQIVKGDRLAFVPKNAEIDRTITIGPTLNIYLQLGVDGFIRRRLKRWGVDLDSQVKNQRFAKLGSLGGKDPFVTLDLAGASDTVSLKLCDILLPDEWNSYLLQIRSDSCGLNDPSEIFLGKMSSMGNGFTFVLESLIFTSLIYGVMKTTDGYFDPEECAVFGDDLIVRQHISERLIELLILCGFEINRDKSFLEGIARESCGCDWIQGTPVRPVFLDDTPIDVRELFTDINRLKRILELRWGLEESITVTNMEKWVPEYFRSFVGPFSDIEFDSYLHRRVPHSRYKRGVWEYKRAVYRPERVRKCNKFLFRKIMHDLREAPVTPPFIRGGKLPVNGSRFAVYLRNQTTVGETVSHTSIWCDEYTELLPAERP